MSKKIKMELNLTVVPIDAIVVVLQYMTTKEFFIFMHYYIDIIYNKPTSDFNRNIKTMKGKGPYKDKFQEYQIKWLMETFEKHIIYVYDRTPCPTQIEVEHKYE